MFLKSKKAILPSLILVIVLVWFGAALYFFNNSLENQKGYVGEVQLDVLNLFSDSVSEKIYDEQVLIQNFNDLVVNFAMNGGVADGKGKEGYVYWVKGDFECYPNAERLKKNFIEFLDYNLNASILGNYKYDIIFENNGLVVQMVSNKKYALERDYYSLDYNPSFNVENFYKYDFDSFLTNVDSVRQVVDECGNNQTCWEEKASFNWIKDNNLYKVELISDKLSDAFGEKEVILRAAIDFNSINPLIDGDLKCLV